MEKTSSSGYTKSLDLLVQRFRERHDPQNPLHKDFQIRLNDLTSQMYALEVIRQNREARPLGDTYQAHVGRAAGRLKQLAEDASNAITAKSTAAEGSFEVALRKESGLVNGPFAAEVRQIIHGLKPGEKVKIIQSMIEGKDGASLSAILDAPSILTGLSSEDLGKFREQYFNATCPDLVRARDTFRDLTEHVITAVKTSISAASEYSDQRKLRELELREAEAAKAQAALREA